MLSKKLIRYVLIGILSVVFVVSAVMIIKNLVNSKQTQDDFDELYEIITEVSENTTATSSLDTSQPQQTTQTVTQPAITRNISKLREMNSDCVGWVSIPNTKVNYPVMYTPDNPQKYLKRNFYNKYSAAGVPFIDSRCDLNSTNIIIYGHNMKNRTLFGSLREYLKASYLKAHPVIEFETENGCEYYTIVDVRKTDINDDWYFHNLNSKQDGKHYLTLSTCYGTNKNARLLIIAVKNENNKDDADKTENTNSGATEAVNSDLTESTASETEGT